MSRPVSLKVEISNLAEMLRKQASEKPHIDYIAAPNTFLLSTHPITYRIRNGPLKQALEQLLAIIYAREDVRLDISKIVTSLGEHVLTLKIEPPTLEEVFFLVYGGEGR